MICKTPKALANKDHPAFTTGCTRVLQLFSFYQGVLIIQRFDLHPGVSTLQRFILYLGVSTLQRLILYSGVVIKRF